MAVFLRVHGTEVLSSVGDDDEEGVGKGESLKIALEEWKGVAEEEGRRLGELVGYCSGVVGFLRAPR